MSRPQTIYRKANYMFRTVTLEKLNNLIPSGERSQFVDQAVDHALIDMARRKAVENMEKFRREYRFHMTDEEIRKAREYGRE